MSKEVKRRKYWINPHVHCGCDCGKDVKEDHDEGCTDTEDAYRLIYELPGVKKKDISLKVVKNGIRMNAVRDSFVEYVNEYPFLMDADTKGTTASYEEGLLIVNVPIIGDDPFKKTDPIKIN
ncbi:MAG: Hsp20/alpha crystallin family protein [Candidatus Heimdallarchaeaceae archaeon]|jgi:HSP20 family molecular chaperone IbpA